MGCIGGLFGALFNEVNKYITIWRIANVKGFGLVPPEPIPGSGKVPRSGWIRLFEAICVIAVVTSFSFWMPYWANDCRPLDQAINRTCALAAFRTDARGMEEC